MRSRFLLVLKLLVGFLLFLLLTAAFLARCTNFDIRAEGKILFGYDEKKHRFQFGESPVYYLDGIDGPYLIGDTLYLVQENSTISKKVFRDSIVQVPIKSAPSKGFQVPLRAAYPRSAATYSLPTQLIAISDIEGNFKAFSSFLQVHGVINDRYEWTYGKGHLVLNGDFVDRGEQVLPVLWLIYKLEEEAMAQGGKVHFIMGNHELMNIRGDFRYAKGKYRKIAQEIRPSEERKESYRVLFSESSELGRWLRSKNAMTKIGDYLFVHAGLSPKLLNTELDINDINRIINKNLENRVLEDTLVRLLIGPESPLWYRGLVEETKRYPLIKETELLALLKKYEASTVVIGHTVVEEVSSSFKGKVITMDVKHSEDEFSEQTQGLLIESGQLFKVNGKGQKEPLKALD